MPCILTAFSASYSNEFRYAKPVAKARHSHTLIHAIARAKHAQNRPKRQLSVCVHTDRPNDVTTDTLVLRDSVESASLVWGVRSIHPRPLPWPEPA